MRNSLSPRQLHQPIKSVGINRNQSAYKAYTRVCVVFSKLKSNNETGGKSLAQYPASCRQRHLLFVICCFHPNNPQKQNDAINTINSKPLSPWRCHTAPPSCDESARRRRSTPPCPSSSWRTQRCPSPSARTPRTRFPPLTAATFGVSQPHNR